MSENWCALCAAKDQEIADLKRKTQSADEQLLELRNAATEATEAWNSWERSCEQKDAEIANLKRQLATATSLLSSVEGSEETYVDRIAELERQLEEARKDTERLMNALDNAKAAIKEALSEIVTGCDCDYCNILRNASEAIDAAREGK